MRRLRLRLRSLVLASRLAVLNTVGLYVASAWWGRDLRNAFGQVFLPDFVAHYTGGWLSRDPARLYAIEAQRALQVGWLHDPSFLNLFLSPPYVASLYAALARLSLGRAMVAWTLLSALLLGLADALLRRAAGPVKRAHERLFWLFALASQPLQEALGSGQDTAVTLLLWAGGIRLALGRRDLLAGLVLGLGACKPQLFLLPLLHLVVTRRWRAVAGMATSAGLLAAWGLHGFGLEGYRGWVSILRSPYYVTGVRRAQLWKMHSIVASLEALAPAAWGTAAQVVGHALALGLAGATLRVTCRMGSPRHAWALLAVATVLVSPHLFSYDLTLVLVAARLLLGERWSPALRRALVAASALVWVAAGRAALVAGHGWPLSALAGSWTPLALVVVWREIARRGQSAAVTASPPEGGPAPGPSRHIE